MKRFVKKIVCGAFLALAVMGAVTGCGSKNDNEAEAQVEIDVQKAADDILSNGSFKDKLAVVDKTIALTRLYSLDETQVKSSAFYTNSNATAEEIAVIETNSQDYVDTVKSAFETRIASQKAACKDYLPDEMPKLESAVIYSNGNYVILCVSEDNAAAKELIKDLFK